VEFLSRFILQVVTTGLQTLIQVQQILKTCSPKTIDMLQVREKTRNARELVQWYQVCKADLPTAAIIINDRVDVAAAVNAEGVQLAYHSLSTEEARKILPKHAKVGCSVHSIDEAQHAAQNGANYVIYGHIYHSPSKPDLKPAGIDALRQLVKAVQLPVIAIGGIQTDNIEEVLSTGCAGIAVMSSFFQHANPAQQALQFRTLLDQSKYKPSYSLDLHHDNKEETTS
jgi:thiazole tautomerase (transcriptional regulator TenI)